MNVPGSPKAQVWVGFILSVVGIGVAGYAYTGDRAYDIVYVLVAVLGFAVLVVGALLMGWGQAHKPRLGGKAAARKDRTPKPARNAAGNPAGKRATKPATTPAERGSEGRKGSKVPKPTKQPIRAKRRARRGNAAATSRRLAPVGAGGALGLTLECRSCAHVFEARGEPPFTATCPNCGHEADVVPPRTVEPAPRVEPLVRGSPSTARARAEPGAPSADDAGDASEARAPETDELDVTLACSSCDHAFRVRGRLPMSVTCPSCAHRATVAAPERVRRA